MLTLRVAPLVTLITLASASGVASSAPGRSHVEPAQAENFYERLITSADRVDVLDIDGDGMDHRFTAALNGGPDGFWQNSADTSWTAIVKVYTPPRIRTGAANPVPRPETDSFIAAHTAGAIIPNTYFDGSNQVYELNVNAAPVDYYTWNFSGTDFTLEQAPGAKIKVRGRAVWLFPRGVFIGNVVTVEADPPGSDACLIVVAEPNGTQGSDPTAGIWFRGGLNSEVPVILVTSGRVIVEQVDNFDRSTAASSLSIFAGNVFIGGPQRNPTPPPPIPPSMNLTYDPIMSDALIDSLSARGALPNAKVPTAALVALFSADRVSEGVELRWRLAHEASDVPIEVERRDTSGPWQAISTERRKQGDLSLAFDRMASADDDHEYRLRCGLPGEEALIVGPISVRARPAILNFALGPQFPNPSNGTTSFFFALPRKAAIRLSVLDAQGRRIGVIADGIFPPGRHEAAWRWDAKARALASGVYFLCYETPERMISRRIVLAR